MMDEIELGHLWRVAAWCDEVARKAGLDAPEREALERAAVLQYRTRLSVDSAALTALAADLGIPAPGESNDVTERAAEEVLRALHGDQRASQRARGLALILDRCKDLDIACQLDARVHCDPDCCGLDGAIAEVREYLGPVGDADLTKAAQRISVFPVAAQRALAMTASVDISLADLAAIIADDQVLALHVVAEANAVRYAARQRVLTIADALARIGLDRGRQLVCAASLRAMFGGPPFRALWNHSLDVAQAAWHFSGLAGVNRDEALLAGLVHDIGKLVCLGLPPETVRRCDRLTRKGCPDMVVERVLFGHDHSTIAGRLLTNWKFNQEIVHAVENHHTPERGASVLAAVLYLAETAIPAPRHAGLVSEWRERLALRNAGLNASDAQYDTCEDGFAGLRFVA